MNQQYSNTVTIETFTILSRLLTLYNTLSSLFQNTQQVEISDEPIFCQLAAVALNCRQMGNEVPAGAPPLSVPAQHDIEVIDIV